MGKDLVLSLLLEAQRFGRRNSLTCLGVAIEASVVISHLKQVSLLSTLYLYMAEEWVL